MWPPNQLWVQLKPRTVSIGYISNSWAICHRNRLHALHCTLHSTSCLVDYGLLHNSNWPTTVYSFKEVAFNYPYGFSGRKILKEILHDRHFNCKIHILTGLKSNITLTIQYRRGRIHIHSKAKCKKFLTLNLFIVSSCSATSANFDSPQPGSSLSDILDPHLIRMSQNTLTRRISLVVEL